MFVIPHIPIPEVEYLPALESENEFVMRLEMREVEESKRIHDWNAEAPVLGAPPPRPPPPGMEASSVMLSEVALSEEGDGADMTDDALDVGPSFGDDDVTDEDGIMTGEESEPMLLLPPS